MHTRRIASLEVSAIGLGCMNLSMGYGERPDDAVSITLIQEAIDLGCTFLNTATLYGGGHNETVVGKAIKGRRQDVVLASKCGLTRDGADGRPESITRECDASLAKLDTDVIDLYYLHRPDPAVPIEDSVGALSRLVEAGKLREIGLSEVSTPTLRRALAVWPIAAVQSEYSFRTGGISREQRIARPVPRNCRADRLHDGAAGSGVAAGPSRSASDSDSGHQAYRLDARERCVCRYRTRQGTVAELDALINESTVIGERYTSERMAGSEAELDRDAVAV